MRPGPYLFAAGVALLLTATAVTGISHLVFRKRTPESNSLEDHVARALLEGRKVFLTPQLNPSLLRWRMASLLPAAPDLVIYGSSHSLAVTSRETGPGSMANFSLLGASLPEHLAVAGILAKRNLTPHRCAIFVDPWLFDHEWDPGRWQAKAGEVDLMETLLNRAAKTSNPHLFRPAAVVARGLPALRITYNLDSIVDALDELYVNTAITTDEQESPMTLILPDGGMRPPLENDADLVTRVHNLALRQYQHNTDIHRYGEFREIYEPQFALFVAWLDYLRETKTEIWLIFPPYHPAIYGPIIAKAGNHLQEIEQRVRALAQPMGYHVVGSYDPAKLGFDERSFQDGDHLNRAGLLALLTPLATARASSAPSR